MAGRAATRVIDFRVPQGKNGRPGDRWAARFDGALPRMGHRTTTPESTRPELTRARPYDYLGKPHFIPMKLGVSWLKADLVSTLDALPLGGTTSLDCRGDLADAPRFTLARTPADLVVLRSHTGPMDAAGNHHWTWPPSALPDRAEWIVYDILGAILASRKAPWVILVPPR